MRCDCDQRAFRRRQIRQHGDADPLDEGVEQAHRRHGAEAQRGDVRPADVASLVGREIEVRAGTSYVDRLIELKRQQLAAQRRALIPQLRQRERPRDRGRMERQLSDVQRLQRRLKEELEALGLERAP